MPLPDFIRRFPGLDISFPADVVSAHALRSDAGLVVFFTFHKAMDLPPHAHKAQWGTVIAGGLDLTIDGQTRHYRSGDSYSIPAGAVHSARIAAGTVVIDVFEEPDRYPLRA